jgi:Pyruvate/2-oxoacid:ferredoxin oxidoreductase delta subunit
MTPDWSREELEKHYIGKMTAITIPVNISISGQQKILDMSELESLIKNAKVLSQDVCTCREKVGKCIEPMEGCIGIDDDAIDSIENHEGKQITADEALTALKRTYDAGLVHMAYVFEGKDNIERICSCCSCCCHSLSAAVRFGYSDHAFSSKFIATHDSLKCDDCGLCVDRCQFGARVMDDDKLKFQNDKCFGCGLCLETCPNEAIAMEERKS